MPMQVQPPALGAADSDTMVLPDRITNPFVAMILAEERGTVDHHLTSTLTLTDIAMHLFVCYFDWLVRTLAKKEGSCDAKPPTSVSPPPSSPSTVSPNDEDLVDLQSPALEVDFGELLRREPVG